MLLFNSLFFELDVPEKKLPRKKITSGNARARRLAVQAGKRLRSLKEGLTHSDSEESYGEVDEKTVEEGWEVEDPAPKTEVGCFLAIVLSLPIK